MPNPNITYEEYLKMFGTKEQLEEYRQKQESMLEWIKENIPEYKPKHRIGKVGEC